MQTPEKHDDCSGKTDRRVRRTKQQLRSSLLELMEVSDISKISVTDICTHADINRGTFYSHYSDPYDLLKQMEAELYDEIARALAASDPSRPMTTYDVVLDVFRCIAENRDICGAILGVHGDIDFLRRVIDLAQRHCFAQWEKYGGDKDPRLLAYIYAFLANGSVGLLQEWISGGMNESPEQLADIVDNMTKGGLSAYFR